MASTSRSLSNNDSTSRDQSSINDSNDEIVTVIVLSKLTHGGKLSAMPIHLRNYCNIVSDFVYFKIP